MKRIILVMLSAMFFFGISACAERNTNKTETVNVYDENRQEVKGVVSEEAAPTGNTGAGHEFSDVNGDEWFADNVLRMADEGILRGYSDGSFKPYNTITYAEFCTVIRRMAVGNSETSQYGHWAKSNMEYALSKSWYDYDEINETVYDNPIPRYMAVKILALGMNIPQTENDEGVYWRYMNEIRDFNSINGRYAYLVVRAYNDGIFTGDETGNFNPDSSLTRAEACAIISRAAGMSNTENNVPQTIPEEPQAVVKNPEAVHSGGVSEHGALKVVGTRLCGSNGEAVQLRGMSSHGLQWFEQYTSRGAIACTAGYGANLFRVAMYTAENGYISQPGEIKKKLINAVNNAVSEDMYVIIDWHILSDSNPMMYVNEAKEFFNEISLLYADCPNVIYEICNEPNGGASWERDIKPYAETVIPVIRANSPDSVILVGSGTWSQDFDKCADDPLDFDNIMYTCHFYAGTHGQWLRDRIDYALSKGAPIFVSEWGTSAADGNGGVFLNESSEWLRFLNDRGISWANWSLCDKNETSAALLPGTSANGWGDESLSESGKFVFGNFK
ncbi:MAG: cellulase family glycosylhydrolase [Oscillospiraceae bacterium]|nr:cellulase family glycosylhydrolase [Oscillospiraceae bacterium]